MNVLPRGLSDAPSTSGRQGHIELPSGRPLVLSALAIRGRKGFRGRKTLCYAESTPRQAKLSPQDVDRDSAALIQAIETLDPTSEGEHTEEAVHPVLADASNLRKLVRCSDAAECMAKLLDLSEAGGHLATLSEHDCLTLIAAAVDRGNVDLAQSVYDAMSRTKGGTTSCGLGANPPGAWGWPAPTLKSTELMVLLLARELRVTDALRVVGGIRSRGMPTSEEVPFGVIVDSPRAPGKPLAIVLPQEGSKIVGCATSRFEFEVFSGTVKEAKSEALNASQNLLQRFVLRQDVCQAVHELAVSAPDGSSRTFRFGTSSANIPAQVGQRVSVVAAPAAGSQLKKRGLLTSSPPNTRPGEPLTLTNHQLGETTALMRPPITKGLPPWALPVGVTLLLGDAGSTFLDPNYPLLFAGVGAAAAASFVGGNQVLLPRLKQLPENSMAAEEIRQQLLEQHSSLMTKTRALVATINEDILSLARLWQLQVKMQSVGTPGSYDSRLERVVKARAQLEDQLCKRLGLLESYSRIANMIEIEVEMNTQVPKSEVADIEKQIEDLLEVEAMQREWQLQTEAEDELERLLRSA